MRRLLPIPLFVATLVAASLGVPTSASAQDPVLDQPRRGADAVRVLGEKLSAVARTHDTTAGTLRERLHGDDSLWVDVSGRLFYVDPVAPEHTEAATSTTEVTSSTPADVFALRSRPAAQRTVYLDFDGHGGPYGGQIGKAWSSGYTGGDGVAEPYDRDGNDAFSQAEKDEIYSIWRLVAEDFAPFDVNVTTAAQSFEQINRLDGADSVYGTRVVLTSTTTSCGCGGVAYVGVFDYYGGRGHSYYQPAFVYNEGAKYAAEAASHEAGHNLGLSHDGTSTDGYYAGHGDWAPIMGVGYYEPITHWSHGEYSGANNHEDDFAVAGVNGAPLRGDDHAVGAGATPVGAGVHTGVIASPSDVDAFTFSVSSDAAVGVDVSPAVVSPNLDVEAVLHDSTGNVVASGTGTSSLGLGATISANLVAGTYLLSIDGVGAHDPMTTGYSDYGSVGSYAVTLTGATIQEPATTGGDSGGEGTTGGGSGTTPEEPAVPPTDPSLTSATTTGSLVELRWAHDGESVSSFEVQREKRHRNGSWVDAVVLTVSDPAARYWSETPGGGTYRYRIRALNSAGASGWSAVSDPLTTTKTTGTKSTK